MACMTPLEAALGAVTRSQHAVEGMTPQKVAFDGVACTKHAVMKMLVHRGCDVNLTRRSDLSLSLSLSLCSRAGISLSLDNI